MTLETMNLTIEQALAQAIEAHTSANLQKAEYLYRLILDTQPTHPETNHNLGVLLVFKQPLQALSYLKTAMETDPDRELFWLSYVKALMETQHLDEANQCFKEGKSASRTGAAVNQLEAMLKQRASESNQRLNGDQRDEPESRNPSQQINALLASYNAGHLQLAEQQARTLAKSHPNHPFGWKALGTILGMTGRLEESLEPIRQSIRLNPADAEMHHNLGAVLYKLDRFTEAETSCREATRLKTDFADAHYNLGNTLKSQSRLLEAEASYRATIHLRPNHANAHNNLAATLTEQGKFSDAQASCQEAIRLQPDSAEAYNNLGNAFKEAGQFGIAETNYREAIRLKPAYAEAHNNLGNTLRTIGRFDEAVMSYREALRLQPNYTDALRMLGSLNACDANDAFLKQLIQQSKSVTKEEDRIHLAFALGKTYEDLGRYAEAYPCYLEGNALRKKALAYQSHTDEELFLRLKQAFPRRIQAPATIQNHVTPILIVGMPRSGTSLVEQVLASHPEVQALGELDILHSLLKKHILHTTSTDLSKGYHLATKEYLAYLTEKSAGHRFATDKMPMNFRWLGFILSVFPSIKIIHVKRDPKANCWGIFKQFFPASGLGYAFDLADIVRYYELYQDLMAHWHQIFPGAIYDLDYEKLTQDQEGETRKLLDHCGLPWDASCLEFEKTARPVSTASATQVRQKIYQGSSSAWKHYAPYIGSAFEKLESGNQHKSTLHKQPTEYDNNLTRDPRQTPITETDPRDVSEQIQELISTYNAGNFQFAEQQAKAILHNHPDHPLGWKLLGTILCITGRIEQSLNPMRQAARLNPLDADVFNNLGVTLSTLGHFSEAEANCREATRLAPHFADAHYNLGNALNGLELPEEAEASYRETIRIKPTHLKAHNNLSATLREQGKLAEAVTSAQQAIRLKPDFADAHCNLGNTLRNMGNIAEAETCYQEAIRLKPDYAEALRMIGSLNACDANDAFLKQLIQQSKSVTKEEDRIHIAFALGKAYEDLGRYAEAYPCYLEGNALRKKALAYQSHTDEELFLRLKQAFPRRIQAPATIQNHVTPILIVGMPRSGTSLVEQVLASHPEVQALGELDILHSLLKKHILHTTSTDLSKGYHLATKEYLAYLTEKSAGHRFATDKMPMNFRWLGFILSVFPSIKIIHVKRDPKANCWGIFKQFFPASGLGYAFDLADIVRYYELYQDLMAHWHQIFPGAIYDLDYEKLTQDQEGETRKLLDHCGLPWDASCLEFEKTARPVSTASATQVRQKIYQGSSSAWKHYAPYIGSAFEKLESGNQHKSTLHKQPTEYDNNLTRDPRQTPITETDPRDVSEQIQELISTYNAGNFQFAEQQAKAILHNHPDHPLGWKLLGTILCITGRIEQSLNPMRQAARLNPLDADVFNNLGVTLSTLGHFSEAEANCREATRLAPDFADAHYNLGNALNGLELHTDAEACYRKAVLLQPDHPKAYHNLGITLRALGQLSEAESSAREAIRLKPNYPEAHANLGVTLLGLRRPAEAEACCREAIRLKPDDAEAYGHLGNALKDLGHLAEAAEMHRKAIRLKPDFAEAHVYLGNTFRHLSRLTEAEASYREAIRLKPDFAEAHGNLANTLKDLGRLVEAEASYQESMRIKPDYIDARNNMLMTMRYNENISIEDAFHAHQAFSQQLEQSLASKKLSRDTFANNLDPNRTPRIGLVSGDLKKHAVAYFMLSVLQHIDPRSLQVFAYANVRKEDDISDQLRTCVHRWSNITSITDAALAEQIRSDQIDVLIDLSGHTAHNRLGVFALRAAPVQAHYLGYPGSTGLSEMDYWIGDPTLTPKEIGNQFSEALWSLPRVWVTYNALDSLPAPLWQPSHNGTVWLGSFNNLLKITPNTIALWARVMKALPEGRLLLKTKELADATNRERIWNAFSTYGIERNRIELQYGKETPRWEQHMAYYDRVDIALDPVGPVCGGTTSCDALWMGVPVITKLGDRMSSRMTASMLTALRRDEWIASDDETYIAKVVNLARDVERRKIMRMSQREQMQQSPLCDAKGMALALEDAFKAMFKHWCSSQTTQRSVQ
ncbi:MAG: tetratricopeptide repeat protein [Zetaproteobacteria bacterium]|nr:tetratricopeptide repeat protein [Zetaproteobacteria bacterium]